MHAAGGRFEVDERSGVVRTRGTDLFQLDMEYVLYVKAEDQNGRIDERRFQSTLEERLSIVGGKRAPQFYMTAYEAEIPENQKKDSELVRKSILIATQPSRIPVCTCFEENANFIRDTSRGLFFLSASDAWIFLAILQKKLETTFMFLRNSCHYTITRDLFPCQGDSNLMQCDHETRVSIEKFPPVV